MLEAKESTEVAKQNQNRRPPQQPPCGVDVAVDRHEVEVEIDPHRTMMRWPRHRYVILITEEHRRLVRFSSRTEGKTDGRTSTPRQARKISFNRMNMWTRGFRGRRLTVALLAVALVVAGVQLANPHSYLAEAVARIGETGYGPDASLTNLTSVDRLQANFNRDAGHPRLILLLSPT